MTKPSMNTQEQRQRFYKLLQTGNRELKKQIPGWDDEAYRQVLFNCGATEKDGRFSASTMSLAEMEKALATLKQKGFKPTRKSSGKGSEWRGPRIAKLNAMWIALHDADVVQDRSENAMQQWCINQVPGIQRLQWATSGQLNQAIEGMKQMCRQRGIEIK